MLNNCKESYVKVQCVFPCGLGRAALKHGILNPKTETEMETEMETEYGIRNQISMIEQGLQILLLSGVSVTSASQISESF